MAKNKRRNVGKVYSKKQKRSINRVDSERLKLYKRTMEEVSRVNKRLEKLSKQGYSGTWSSKKLLTRIGAKRVGDVGLTRRGGTITGITISPKMTMTQLVAVQKASRQFLESKTSTLQGIKETRQKTIESLKVSTSDIDNELSNEDVEFLYDMLEIREMQDLVESFGASRVWNITQDAIDMGDSREDFLKRFERELATLNDDDMKDKANRIYDYILSK